MLYYLIILACAPSSSAEVTATNVEQCVTSPNYDNGGSYIGGFQCNWLLKVSKCNHVLVVQYQMYINNTIKYIILSLYIIKIINVIHYSNQKLIH